MGGRGPPGTPPEPRAGPVQTPERHRKEVPVMTREMARLLISPSNAWPRLRQDYDHHPFAFLVPLLLLPLLPAACLFIGTTQVGWSLPGNDSVQHLSSGSALLLATMLPGLRRRRGDHGLIRTLGAVPHAVAPQRTGQPDLHHGDRRALDARRDRRPGALADPPAAGRGGCLRLLGTPAVHRPAAVHAHAGAADIVLRLLHPRRRLPDPADHRLHLHRVLGQSLAGSGEYLR